ncbi:hypothetical protein Hanom_Chr00s003922g01716711 [Helianthus anomalus]
MPPLNTHLSNLPPSAASQPNQPTICRTYSPQTPPGAAVGSSCAAVACHPDDCSIFLTSLSPSDPSSLSLESAEMCLYVCV